MSEADVTCAWCEGVYRGIFPPSQGGGCAADVFLVTKPEVYPARAGIKAGDWILHGQYGSALTDQTLFLFIANKPTKNASPVCDKCIQNCMDAGDLTEVCWLRASDYNFFEKLGE